ncbi:MAG: cytidyltransferase [Lentisphaerae bacterium GWF2_57_35]|nr:MAG: cytidyltransferase [Lentisphaerae bacterium GWF2_57_35]
MTAQKIGFTLGKYAPFHKGHQLVIETALSEMDHVIVMIYNALETTNCPLSIRSKWIRDLYPSVEVLEAPDGPTLVGHTPEIKKLNEDYILRRIGRRGVTHFYSSEFYGEHVSKALGSINRLVDPDRTTIPVSGTLLRQEPYAYRTFLHPRVYRDLVTNVVFLGAPSTGKTTVARVLAETFKTVWMPEYAREYWEHHQVNRRLSPEQLVEIAEGHLDREEKLLYDANRYLFTDTNAITTYMFAQYYHGAVLPKLKEYTDQSASRYDLVFLCGADIPYESTWDRSGDVNRKQFQKQIEVDLGKRKVQFFMLSGNLEERVQIVSSVLAHFDKYKAFDVRMDEWRDKVLCDRTQ